MTTAIATRTVRYYEVCANDAYNVSVVLFTAQHLYDAQSYVGLNRSLKARIYAIYTDGNVLRVA